MLSKIPYTGQLISSRHLLLTVLEADKSKTKFLEDSVVRAGFLVHRWLSSLLCPHMVEGSGALWGLFCENPNPILEGFTFSPPSDPTFKYHHLRHQDLTWVCGEHIHSVYIIISSLSRGLVRINQYSLETTQLSGPIRGLPVSLWSQRKPRGEVSYERVPELSSSFMKNTSKKFSVSPSVVSIKGGIPGVCVCVCVWARLMIRPQ